MQALGFRAMQCPRVVTERIKHFTDCPQCLSIAEAKRRAAREEFERREQLAYERDMNRNRLRKQQKGEEEKKKNCCVM